MPTPADRPADLLRAAAEKLRAARFSGAITATPIVAALIGARMPLAAWLDAEAAPPITAQHSDRCTDPQCTTLAALAVARQLLGTTSEDTADVTPSVDRRDRYAAAMALRDGHPEWPVRYEDDERDYRRRADAVMAVADAEQASLRAEVEGLDEALRGVVSVSEKDGARLRAELAAAALPAPADRAAVLNEAADEIAGIDFHPNARARSLDIATGLAHRLRALAGEAAAGAHHPEQAGCSYRLEHRHREESTWRPNTPGIGANWSWQSRETAAERLAEARTRWPDFEHRLIETKTETAVRVLPDCLACGHYKCDSDGPCGALLNSWERCTCTGTPAVPAAPEETR
ncbi:hypothetical protein STHAL_18305 [Streptomyces halstedii]|uniref:Uncharacterized protein n=1 Tax=Streptomyces halstedii TaxID=1944 RepID=A0ABS6TT01_STRHA|nr:hypothetical protein [Streptomyces halstedii]MBV7671405.1 hypothetical protein [Streptomyces halstedii]